jgi:uncharacterized repeat protein (TIGR01451 family)
MTPASVDIPNRRVTWNIGTVPAGTTASITVTFLATGVVLGDFLTNYAYLNYTNSAGVWQPTRQSSFTTRVTDAIMTIDKNGPVNANSGQEIEYTITYRNTGNSNAINVLIIENYPVGITFISALPAPSNLGTGNNTWTIANVAPGTGSTITIRVRVNANVPSMTPLLNEATLDYQNAVGTPRTQVQDSITTIVRDPLLTIVKTATAQTVSNGTINYVVTITNIGDANAQNVVLTENYPSEVTFISANISAFTGGNVWLVGTLASGESWSVNITVRVTTYVQGIISNVAYADYEDGSGETQAQVSASADTLVADPHMTITKVATQSTSTGGVITYIITIQNTGTGDAYNVVVEDVYAPGTTYLNSSEVPTGLSNDTWFIPMVPAGWSGTLFINVSVDQGATGTLINTAFLDYENMFGTSMPQQMAEATTRINTPSLRIEKVGPETSYHGGLITYTMTIENLGDGNATQISVTDMYPAALTYVSSSIAPSFGTNVWNFTVLAPGETIYLNITFRVADYDAANVLTGLLNLAAVTYQNVAGVAQPVANDSWMTAIIAPMLTINKAAPGVVLPDQTMTYSITYANNGNGWTSLATITETYPTGITFVSATPAPTTGNNVWVFGNLAPGSSGTIEIIVAVTAVPGTTLLNTVNISYLNLAGSMFPVIFAQASTLVTGDITVVPPRVTSTPPAYVWAGQNFTLYADAMGFNAGIDTVILYFTDIFGNSWSSVMAPLLVTTNGSGMYQLLMPAQPYKGFVSYFVWVNDTNGNENRTGIFDVPVRLPPYFVWGNVYSNRGLPVGGAMVLITDVQTNETVIAYTDGTGGYRGDLATLYSGHMDGEILRVFATDGTFYGRNESFIDLDLFSDASMAHPNRRVNVVMNEIPEFVNILMPILGVLVLVSLLGRRRRKKVDAEAI